MDSKVSQRARDAAEAYFREHNLACADWIARGDHHPLIDAFARFEATTRTPSPDAVREAVGREEARLDAAARALYKAYEDTTDERVARVFDYASETEPMVRDAWSETVQEMRDWAAKVLAAADSASALQLADTRMEATPAARWREEGKPDPHGTDYDCERASLCGGHLTDDEVAFQTAMLMRGDLNHEAVLQTAKDRIRWLSRALVAASTPDPRMERGMVEGDRLAKMMDGYASTFSALHVDIADDFRAAASLLRALPQASVQTETGSEK